MNTPPKAADWSSTNTNWNAVYPLGKSKPGMLSTRDSPPANAVKKKSGKINPGSSSEGVVNTLCSTRQATAIATEKKFLMSASASCDMAQPAAVSEAAEITAAKPNASASASQSQPAMIRLRSPSIRYEIGLKVATVRNQSVSIKLRGRFIDERNSPTKSNGKRPCTASPEPVRSAKKAPSAPNAIATTVARTSRTSAADDARCQPHADDQPDREVEDSLDESRAPRSRRAARRSARRR